MVQTGKFGFPEGGPKLKREDPVPAKGDDPVEGKDDERGGEEEPNEKELPGAVPFEKIQVCESHNGKSREAG
jgi:hypothetical protein